MLNRRLVGAILLHELGHAAGLNHEYYQLSVMNYPLKPFRAWGLPFMHDAEGIRTVTTAA